MIKEFEKYIYNPIEEIIYELDDENRFYKPIILVEREEEKFSDNLEADNHLRFLKMSMLDYYVYLCKEKKLKKYIDKYLLKLFDAYKLFLSQMKADKKTLTIMDKRLAMEVARDFCI